jgi:uncharacterized damage-inducible protein DinB
MAETTEQGLLEALLDSWDRNNRILVNLLGALSADMLGLRATAESPTIGQLFTHIHFVRLVFVEEDAPAFARALPDKEWLDEPDQRKIARMLDESAVVVREAVRAKVEAGEPMDLHYDHPILMLQHMVWHEGYHHGQIKVALKHAGLAMDDERAGPLTWDVWMEKSVPRRD